MSSENSTNADAAPVSVSLRQLNSYYQQPASDIFSADESNSNHQNSYSNSKQVLTKALGLLLKHRGGPGFGRGRLQGAELQLLEPALVAAGKVLHNEALSAS